MSYPYVQAYYDYGLRTRPALGFVIHMAEGGGTVGYLSKPNPNRVSVHYVIERTGRIVQMLRENRISGSLRPSAIRTTDDAAFMSPDGDRVIYGATAAKRALERYWGDPNTVVLSCEVEGFAATGPNIAQKDALERLVRDVRSRYPTIALLAHRDFADYKRCPGQLIPWKRLGGHYPSDLPDTSTEDMPGYIIRAPSDGPVLHGTLFVPKGTEFYHVHERTEKPLTTTQDATRDVLGMESGGGTAVWLVSELGGSTAFIYRSRPGLVFTELAPKDCTAETLAATAAERQRWTYWLGKAPK